MQNHLIRLSVLFASTVSITFLLSGYGIAAERILTPAEAIAQGSQEHLMHDGMPGMRHFGDMASDLGSATAAPKIEDVMPEPQTFEEKDITPINGVDHSQMDHGDGMAMDGDGSTSPAMEMMMTEMQRMGSGTAWQPMDNPMLMKMWMTDKSMSMLHWNGFLEYDSQGGPRGRDKVISENWLMGSVSHTLGNKSFYTVRAMLSGEPFTQGKTGYPLLFQTGEALNGRPLIDSQHPHDLFMELSAQYYRKVAQDTWLRFYAAPVGEPALGPVAYPHRYSALLIPQAALSHHILDSSHITFGVATAALIHKKWQFEGSVFNGREPDEYRYDFDFSPWKTSFSGRVSYLPSDHWALQVSSGFLNSPEPFENKNQERTTASAMYSRTWLNGWWASTLAAGHNFEAGPDDNSVLLESIWNFRNRNYLFGRIENIQRHDLLASMPDTSFNITSFSVGAARDLLQIKGIPITLGAMVGVYTKPNGLDQAYGNFPMSFHIFLHTNAPRSRGMRMMGMHH